MPQMLPLVWCERSTVFPSGWSAWSVSITSNVVVAPPFEMPRTACVGFDETTFPTNTVAENIVSHGGPGA